MSNSIVNARVRFDSASVAVMSQYGENQTRLSDEERKGLWYSREELMNSCLEAKKIVNIINSVNGDFGAIDHNRVCVVGLEKFHGKKEREKYRKLLIKSVLIRQEMNRGMGKQDEDCLCEISNMLSSSFKEFALWQAAMHKFHANSSYIPTQPDRRQFTENDRAKRQRIDTGPYHTSQPPSSPPHMIIAPTSAQHVSDHGQVRQEMHQIMAEFCS